MVKKKKNMNKILKQCLGVDVSKKSLSLVVGLLTPSLQKEFKAGNDVSNDLSGFKELDRWLVNVLAPNVEFMVLMEATGTYHQKLAHYLHGKGYKVCIMQSGRVKRYAQSLDQRSKTDALDSKMLSMLGLERELRSWHPPSDELLRLKALSRERSSLLKDRTMVGNRNDAIASGVYEDKKASKRHSQRIKLLNTQIMEIEEEMRELINESSELKRKLDFIMSIPGVSFISAATIVGETLGFESIANAKQLTSYAGYDVVLRESGTFSGKSGISKKGNSHIRAALHMPSMTCVRCNPTLRKFYLRLKPNKVKPLVALIAVQRKLLILMFTLWKNETLYDARYEEKKQQRSRPLLHRITN